MGPVRMHLVLVVLLSAQVAALADENRARQLVARGEAAYAAGHFVDAARAFDKAYLQSRRPRLLWNIAQSWRRQYALSGDIADLQRAAWVLANYEDLAESESDRAEARAAHSEVNEAIRQANASGKPPMAADSLRRPVDSSPARSPRMAARLRLSGIAIGAGGIALLVAGAVMAAVGRSAFDEINTPAPGYVFNPDTQTRQQILQPLGSAFLALSGVALVTGVIVFAVGVTEAKRMKPSVKLNLLPQPTSLSVEGSF